VTVQFFERIRRGQGTENNYVVTTGLDQFTASAAEEKRLIEVAQ
jgi:hypothetical protein